jgi:hypothetical protein
MQMRRAERTAGAVDTNNKHGLKTSMQKAPFYEKEK